MSIVDSVLKRWAKDISQLEKAAVGEEQKIADNNRVIDARIADNLAAEKEAGRARQVVANLKVLLATPVEPVPTFGSLPLADFNSGKPTEGATA